MKESESLQEGHLQGKTTGNGRLPPRVDLWKSLLWEEDAMGAKKVEQMKTTKQLLTSGKTKAKKETIACITMLSCE